MLKYKIPKNSNEYIIYVLYRVRSSSMEAKYINAFPRLTRLILDGCMTSHMHYPNENSIKVTLFSFG